ncbi:MAG: hypothetical protein A2900_05480 [Candidatus Chisholmbacteria bacterium RIFCSPLOWO2_01_FULL_50_28]|uniref:Uncharacterized protein n=1 Tax=Candidatus Chisholmbacteria bacterium RIFCSPHIGHO2_01_FULL_52_32 TaxID=1797591 RepID=A0A1G1VRV6_9BACT|nr:MAG: hypothetical protein A2786_01265 [Candidatus Chisholmbacteria bacterium RIFCSPHIGHO2_01_FULL_52_32]OGY20496.1 MAG: hypothetical protein A2900_05480 [Candidatus Chisholmbacteria bacterium RIFCSPLOWO2_01_FULL_50_28]
MSPRYGGRELSPEYRAAGGLVVLGLALSACTTEAQATITPEQFPTQPRSTEVLPSPTPEFSVGRTQSQEDIRVGLGRAVGAGGPESFQRFEQIHNNSLLQDALNRVGLNPWIGELLNGRSILTQVGTHSDGRRTCFPTMPELIYNPDVPARPGQESGQDDWLSTNNFVVSYGDGVTRSERLKAISAVTLRNTTEDVICVNTYVSRDRPNPYGKKPGTLLNVLINRQTGRIYGTLRAAYAQTDQVEFDARTGSVFVNGVETWYEGEGMADLVIPPDPMELGRQLPGVTEVLKLGDETLAYGRPGQMPLFKFNTDTGEWATFVRDTGFALVKEWMNIPESMLKPLSVERTQSMRFVDGQGDPLPYGYIGYMRQGMLALDGIHKTWYLSDPVVSGDEGVNVLLHGRLRGVLADLHQLPPGFNPDYTTRWAILEFPIERVDPATGDLRWTGDSQFAAVGLQYGPGNDIIRIPVRFLEGRNIENQKVLGRTPTTITDIIQQMPEGASVILGVPTSFRSRGSDHAASVFDAFRRGELITDSIPFDTLVQIIDSSFSD